MGTILQWTGGSQRRLVRNHKDRKSHRLSIAINKSTLHISNVKQHAKYYQGKTNLYICKFPESRLIGFTLEESPIIKVKTCLNQIVKVLLALFLANFLLLFVSKTPYSAKASDVQTLQNEAPSIFGDFRRVGRSFRPSFKTSLPFDLSHNINDFFDEDDVNQLQRSQNFKISPKPCNFGRIEGTCMFVWECIKSEGRHVGMCVDSFMFGSCCTHNITDNIVLSQTFSYTRPTKPVGLVNSNHRPRPPHQPHKPAISGMTTIERPHGAGTLVIRPSGPHHQGSLSKPHYTKPTIATHSNTISNSSFKPTSASSTIPIVANSSNSSWNILTDNLSASSTSLDNLWQTQTLQIQQTTSSESHQQQQHWHFPTEPNFITKPRPPNWDKPHSVRPKPKPTKKPAVVAEDTQTFNVHNQLHQHQHPHQSHQNHQEQQENTHHQTPPGTNVYSTTIFKPPFQPASNINEQDNTHTFIKNTTKKPGVISPYKPIYKPTSDSPTTSNTQMQPTKYTTEKYYPKPPSSLPALSTTNIETTTLKPTPVLTTVTNTEQPPTSSNTLSTSTTSKPISSFTTYTTTIPLTTGTPSTASTTMSVILPASQTIEMQSQSILESNEITDTNFNEATIKTISAARTECGVPVLARPETRIVGGKSATFGRWPWQVSVRRTSFFGFSSTHRCGGALINENWIATAGHCVDDLLISQIRIRVGEYDFSHVQEQLPYIERAVSKKVVHPKYNFFTYEYDLALVKLEQPLEFAPHVSPICLPQTDSLLIGMNATVTGWGRLSEGGTLPSVLQEVSVPIVSNDNCKNMFLRAGRQEFIPEIFLCAGYESGGQDSCQGDSGGPLQVKSQNGKYFLAGIISWGIGCAEANLPGVCTRISKFVPWILDNVS